MTIQLGIFLALICAFVSNLGFFFKHRGACAAAKVDIRHPFRTARQLYASIGFTPDDAFTHLSLELPRAR